MGSTAGRTPGERVSPNPEHPEAVKKTPYYREASVAEDQRD
jgi:hypothetical protein